MAEFVMKYLIEQADRTADFMVCSAATSSEELGNDIHEGTRYKLGEMGIPYKRRGARRIIPKIMRNTIFLSEWMTRICVICTAVLVRTGNTKCINCLNSAAFPAMWPIPGLLTILMIRMLTFLPAAELCSKYLKRDNTNTDFNVI